jgi:hypothetical protein
MGMQTLIYSAKVSQTGSISVEQGNRKHIIITMIKSMYGEAYVPQKKCALSKVT